MPKLRTAQQRWPIVNTMEIFKVFGYSQDWISSSMSSASDDDSLEDFFDWEKEEKEEEQRQKENRITSPLKRKHHTAQWHITGRRRARAKLIRSSFDNSPDILRCSDNIEVDCCGLIGEDPLPIIDMWPFAHHEQRLDPVLVAVEVSGQPCYVQQFFIAFDTGTDVLTCVSQFSGDVGMCHGRCNET
jgi:hypothetical protein